MKNKDSIVVFDLETSGLDTRTCSVVQFAALAVNPITLEPTGDHFVSMSRPSDEEIEIIDPGALAVNKKTTEEIKAAPVESVVFKQFAEFVLKHKTKHLPIACGKNIRHFDLPIISRLCKKYGYWDKKKEQQKLFNERWEIDLEDYLFSWFENSDELPSYKMNDILPYFGIKSDDAHDALVDCRNTWLLVKKFLLLHRQLFTKIKFKGSCI